MHKDMYNKPEKGDQKQQLLARKALLKDAIRDNEMLLRKDRLELQVIDEMIIDLEEGGYED